ncbi:MAG: FAD-binding oxidoreductase [Sphaerochaetaceae bacterium]|nr:FAD-binding oxidoreductase [Sphaerochaetaceae bacterium]
MIDIHDRLISIVGEDNVSHNPGYQSSTIEGLPRSEPVDARFLVKPANSEQVQQLVELANSEQLPLVPVSSGAPHRTGGSYPEVADSVIVDLSGMNRILRINSRHKLAIIEPGVTWAQLSHALRPHGLTVPHPLQPKQEKSVIASLLEREPLLCPKYQWNVNEPLRSMEIVFGSGNVIRSGMGGHRGESDEDWENGTVPVTNAGPHQFDFMKMVTGAQGSFGIVTWASIKLEVLAQEEQALFLEGESVDFLTDFLYKTLKFRFGNEVCLFNRPAMASLLAETKIEFDSYADTLAPWSTLVNVTWGALRAKEKIKAQVTDIQDIANDNRLSTRESLAGIPGRTVVEKILGEATERDWKGTVSPAYGEIFFLTTLDRLSSQLDIAARTAMNHGYDFSQCPVYVQPLHQGVNIHCHIVLPVHENSDATHGFSSMYRKMSRELKNHGAFFSRPYGYWAQLVYEEDSQHTNMTRTMKDILDPKHILNPGKLCFQVTEKGE